MPGILAVRLALDVVMLGLLVVLYCSRRPPGPPAVRA